MSCVSITRLYSPLGLLFHSVPLVEALELRASSPVLVLFLCCLQHHDIVDSALSTRGFLDVNLIEQGYLLVVGRPMVF
jgi:hypothetical protein